jgi:hypothetical protein
MMARNARFGVVAGAFVALAAYAFQPIEAALAQAQGGRPASELIENGQFPRLSNGKPNFQGNWQKVRGGGPPAVVPLGGPAPRGGGPAPAAAPPAAGPAGAPAAAPAGGAPRGGGPPRDPNVFDINGFVIPYTPEATRERKWLNTQETLDGEVLCHLPGTPRSHIAPPYPHVIIQDDKQVVILYEYAHEPHIIPLDNSPLKNTRTWMGESRGHWEGDTLVVVTRNYNGRAYISYNEPMTEDAVVEERFTMTGANTYNYEVKITDPRTYTKPFVMTIKHGRQRDADQLLSYDCLEGEDDLKHYHPESGGTAGLALVKQPATIYGCLRAEPAGNGEFAYTVKPYRGAVVKLTPAASLKASLPVLMDREVKFDGKWAAKDKDFAAVYADVHATGCRAE